MKAFRFSLEKALEWRTTQLRAEEAKLRARAAALQQIERSRAELQAAVAAAEVDARRSATVAADELAALDRYRIDARAADRKLIAERDRRAKAVAEQQSAMLEARRQSRLLERLKERRWNEWKAAADRELEETAAESYLARWESPRPRPYNEMDEP